jgi:hypothetical protein
MVDEPTGVALIQRKEIARYLFSRGLDDQDSAHLATLLAAPTSALSSLTG